MSQKENDASTIFFFLNSQIRIYQTSIYKKNKITSNSDSFHIQSGVNMQPYLEFNVPFLGRFSQNFLYLSFERRLMHLGDYMKNLKLQILSVLLLAILVNIFAVSLVSGQTDPVIEITEIGSFDTNGWAANVLVQNDIVYLSDSEGGLYIIDVSDPHNPTELSIFNENIDHIHELSVDGNLAYIADYTEGFKVVNISDSSNPTQVGVFHDGGEVGTFDISENLAFIADFEDGLEIVNISDPSDPTEIYQYDTGLSYIFNVVVKNDLAYVSDYISASEKSLIILNISDLSDIQEIAEYTIDGEVFSIDFVEDIAYMMCSYGGVQIYNVSDPLSLIEVGSYYNGGNAVDMEFYEGYAIIVGGTDDLEFLDVSNPDNITAIASYSDTGRASGLAIVGDLFFVADGEDGLEILQIEIPTTNTATPDLTGIVLIIGVVGFIVVIIIIAKMRKG